MSAKDFIDYYLDSDRSQPRDTSRYIGLVIALNVLDVVDDEDCDEMCEAAIMDWMVNGLPSYGSCSGTRKGARAPGEGPPDTEMK